MRHLRADYDRFQDPDRIVPEDEPVFLIRGQDPAASVAVRAYAVAAAAAGADAEMVRQIGAWADEMKAYAKRAQHGPPDIPDGQLRNIA